ncbi:MAG TPA: phospholipid carrier-dependent glycosyltransferase [Candidatus Moranbacteria bacterium]|nr:phospholipid carrier-dependent glycosyltransferase [Candidatus Moranbacteria bacterium]
MSSFQKIKNFCKKPGFILALILLIFLLKELALIAVLPIFNGYDEARHYNTIQYLAEPEEKNWPKNEKKEIKNGDLVQRFNYTEEIKKTAEKIRCVGGEDKCDLYKNNLFGEGFAGKNETEINSRPWKQYNTDYPVNMASSGRSFYHKLTAEIEKLLGKESILIRFYALRVFSALLGTIVIFIFYLILKNSGFSQKHSFLLTAIISFQPRFSFYYAYINYDAFLILFFALFTLGAVLFIKNGLNWKNLSLMLLAIFLGIWTKGTAFILLAVFIFIIPFLLFYKKRFFENYSKKYWLYFLLAISPICILLIFQKYLPLAGNFNEIISSFTQYFMKNIEPGLLTLSSKTYWGEFPIKSWTSNYLLNIIWSIQFISIIGLFIFIFSKKRPEFLPEKKYVLFFILMLIALQAGIRAADWKYFAKFGELELQTPGRYFFPNLALHISLVFVGLGMILKAIKKEIHFDFVLSVGLVLMFVFFMHYLFNFIILDFYL